MRPIVTKTRLLGPPRGRGRPVAKYHRQRELKRALDLLRQTPTLCLKLAMLRFVPGPLAIISVHHGYELFLPCKAEAKEAQGNEIQLPGQRREKRGGERGREDRRCPPAVAWHRIYLFQFHAEHRLSRRSHMWSIPDRFQYVE